MTHQQKTLQAMLQAAQQAKDDLHAIQCIVQEAVGISQAFHAGGMGVCHLLLVLFQVKPKRRYRGTHLTAACRPSVFQLHTGIVALSVCGCVLDAAAPTLIWNTAPTMVMSSFA